LSDDNVHYLLNLPRDASDKDAIRSVLQKYGRIQ
jgi:hypothetical protein